jgi:hypothetical protein
LALAVCRALKVLCVAEDAERLAELKRAVVAAEWELCWGATSGDQASAVLDDERPHVLVAVGPFEELVASARLRFPALRIVTDRELPESDAVIASFGQLRGVVRATSPPGGPVRSSASQPPQGSQP